MNEEEEYIYESLDENEEWIYSGLDITVLGLDYRCLYFILVLLIHPRIYTFFVFLGIIIIFYILKIYNLNVMESIKRLRLLISMLFFGNIKKIK